MSLLPCRAVQKVRPIPSTNGSLRGNAYDDFERSPKGVFEKSSRKSLQNKPSDGLVPFFVLGEDIRFEAGCILLGLLKDVLLELAE